MKKSRMYSFKVNIINYGDDDVEYEVKFDDFAEVIGAGDTVEEAIEEAYYNLDAYIEHCENNGIALPVPTSKRSLDDYSGKITIRIPKNLHRDFVEYAEADGMSINSLAIDAFRYYLASISLKEVQSLTTAAIYSCLDNMEETVEEFIKYKDKSHVFKNNMTYSPNACDGLGGIVYGNN